MRLVAWIQHSGNGLAGASVEFHRCAACAAGQLERSSHDYFRMFDDDEPTRSWDGYSLTPPDADALERFVGVRCPAPLDPACPCTLHAQLALEVRGLPIAPWPGHAGDPPPRSGPVHATRVEIADGSLRLVRACAEAHPADLALRGTIRLPDPRLARYPPLP